MAYYRIVVKTAKSKKPVQGIRWINNDSISAVQGLMEKKAREAYRGDYIDCEVQMLAKTCTAVKEYEKNKEKRKREIELVVMKNLSAFTKKDEPGIPLGKRKRE